MRILIYGIFYAPELTGIGKYSGEMGAWLAKQGHTVHALTAMPYYPEWEIHDKYKGKLWHTEYIAGVKIYRCPFYVPKYVNSVKRILLEASFFASSLPIWLKMLFRKKYDIVICVAPPFHVSFLPILYSKLRGVKLITHIQDLQVDVAQDLGMIRNKLFLNFMFSMERFFLNNSSSVSTISLGMLNKIKNKGIDTKKLILFPNWVDEAAIRSLPKYQSLRKEFGISYEDKVVLYSGNLGEKQGLESIIEVAYQLRHNSEIRFLFVGSGGSKTRLQALADSYNLENVSFYPLQSYEKLSALLATADLHLVLQKSSASDLVMPSKLTSILASGGCPLVTAEPGSSLYELISTYQTGILVQPESVDALKIGIENALNSNLDIYKKNARTYAEKYLSKEQILQDFEQDLISIATNKGAVKAMPVYKEDSVLLSTPLPDRKIKA